MNIGSEKIYGQLTELHSISQELSSSLINGETDEVFKKLKKRAAILADLQENKSSVDNKSKQSIEVKAVVNSIINLDKKNMEVIRKTLNTISDSIADLGMEQKAIKNSRSVTMKDQKQLIDFLY